jgi:hypothetical protein
MATCFIRPCDVPNVLEFQGDEFGLWSTMLDLLGSQHSPGIFVCPGCYRKIARSDPGVILVVTDGEVRFMHPSEMGEINIEHLFCDDKSETDFWRKKILDFSRDYVQNRQQIIRESNGGLSGVHVLPQNINPADFRKKKEVEVRPNPGRRKQAVRRPREVIPT